VGNHAFFERRAVDVMTAYLLAAGLSGATLGEFVGWCQNDLDTEAATILRGYPEFTAVRRTLQQAQAVVEETRSGIWETLRDAIACLTDPDVVTSALPRAEDPGLDVETFIRSGGTIYVIGSEDDAATQAPLITAFVQEVLDSARRLAIAGSRGTGHERLAPPFTAVLDEVASICPLPDLPSTLSDSAGRGVLVHYALQSPAQAQARWGKSAATLFDNTTALTILGGLKSEETLKWASLLVGRRLEERRSRQSGRSFSDPGSLHIGTERADILEPAAIRQIPRGRALLIMRSMPALIVRLKPAWKRPDWATLQADARELRGGGAEQEQTPTVDSSEITAGAPR
jgi:type IV secretion system protein VirD4